MVSCANTSSTHTRLRKFENLLMKDGKKEKAGKLIRAAIVHARQISGSSLNANAQECDLERTLHHAISNVQPMFASRKQRLAGRIYEIPVVLPPHKQESLAMRWIIAAASNATGTSGSDVKTRLSHAIAQALLQQGEAYRKKQNMNRFAESNKNYVRYRL